MKKGDSANDKLDMLIEQGRFINALDQAHSAWMYAYELSSLCAAFEPL